MKVMLGIFQQIMDSLLGDLDTLMAYLDDILIKSRNREEYAKHMKLFKKIKEYNFTLSIDKCNFLKQQLNTWDT